MSTTLRVLRSDGVLKGVGLHNLQIDRTSIGAPGVDYQPSARTTGITSAESNLGVVSGVQNFTSASNGQTITGKKFTNNVFISGQNITFKDCLFMGPSSFSLPASSINKIVVLTDTNVSNIVFEDCTFKPQYNTYQAEIIQGAGFTLRRCDVLMGVDGVDILGNAATGKANVTIEGCWFHDLTFFSPDPTHNSDNQTHNDCIQWEGGTNVTIRGNRFDGYYTLAVGNPTAHPKVDGVGNLWPVSPYSNKHRALSILMVNAASGRPDPDNLIFEHNWANGGAVGINGLDTISMTTASVQHNWFGLDWRLVDDNRLTYTPANSFAICVNANCTLTVAGNYLWNEANPFEKITSMDIRKIDNKGTNG